MADTKIINILKSDSLDEIFDEFYSANADEVIFIFPKTSRFSDQPDYFAKLASAAEEHNKKISIMTGDSSIISLARENGMDIIGNPRNEKPKTNKKPAAQLAVSTDDKIRDDEDDSNEVEEGDDEDELSDDFEDDDLDLDDESEDEEDIDDDEDESLPVARATMFDVRADDSQDSDDMEDEATEEDDGLEEHNEEIPEQDSDSDDNSEEEDAEAEATSNVFDLDDTVPLAQLAAARSAKLKTVVMQDIVSPGTFEPDSTPEANVRVKEELSAKKAEVPSIKAETYTPPKEVMETHVRPEPNSKMLWPFSKKADTNERLTKEETRDIDNEIKDEGVKQRIKKSEDTESIEIARLWAEEEKSYKKKGVGIGETFAKRPSRFKKVLFSKLTFIVFGVALLSFGAIVFFTFEKATIVLHPHVEEVDFQLSMSAVTEASEVDVQFAILPGQQFSVEHSVSKTYAAEEEKEVAQKARGEITIYNSTDNAQRLVATTRFESSDGHIYRIPESVIVPAKTGTTPGQIKATVFADAPGEEYNIEPGRFTIPGFKGSPRYDQFYAESSAAMTGGLIGTSPTVGEAQYAAAKTELMDQLRKEITAKLADTAGDLTIVDSPTIVFSDPVTNVAPGEAAESLEMEISATATTIAFRDSDVYAILNDAITNDDSLALLEERSGISYSNVSLNPDGKTMTFQAHVMGMAATKIDTDQVLTEIMGLDEVGIKSYVQGLESVESAEIKLSPFWVTSIPKNPKNVSILVEIK